MRMALINRSGEDLGFDLGDYAHTLNEYNRLLVSFWGPAAAVTCYHAQHFGPYRWAMVFLKHSDDPGALAYHLTTDYGTPLAKVFVDTDREQGADLSLSASHEFGETCIDPDINRLVHGPAGLYAVEPMDPVENQYFTLNGFQMSNFVTPAWYQSFQAPGSVQFDYLRQLTRPFELTPGGYQSVYTDGQWTNVFGSEAKAAAFARENRRGHRSEARKPM